MKRFDIAPFALPNAPNAELKFEEARDVQAVEVVFASAAPRAPRLQYMRKVWPQTRIERPGNVDLERPMEFGWQRMDDRSEGDTLVRKTYWRRRRAFCDIERSAIGLWKTSPVNGYSGDCALWHDLRGR